jgi:hypothetical protein
MHCVFIRAAPNFCIVHYFSLEVVVLMEIGIRYQWHVRVKQLLARIFHQRTPEEEKERLLRGK